MIIKKILNLLRELDKIDTQSFFGHYSSKYVWQQYAKVNLRRAGWKSKKEIIAEQKALELKRFYSTLYNLKKQGFIIKDRVANKFSFWRLTKSGLNKLLDLELKFKDRLESLKPAYLEKDSLKLVIFDIPEKRKRYRQWLRETLINFGFKMLQKSVWLGENKLPENFIHALRRLNSLDCVHIFSIKDRGTLL